MKFDRVGLVGGLAADRPILTTLVLAFGLSALATLGVSEAAGGAAFAVGDLLIAALLLVVAPLLIAGASPAKALFRIMIALVIAGAVAGSLIYEPVLFTHLLRAPVFTLGAFVLASAILLGAGPLFGAMTKFSFIAASAALLGMAGALGLVLQQGVEFSEKGSVIVIVAFIIAAIAGAGALADFAALYASGADRMQASGLSVKRAIPSALNGAVAAALAFGLIPAMEKTGAPYLGALAGLSVCLCAAASLIASAGALALRQTSETMAVEENRRRTAFRERWRPLRGLFPPNASLAIIAIAAIAVVGAAFNMPAQLPLSHLVFVILAAIGAGLIFFSLRAGVFVFFSLIVSATIGGWLWGTFGGPALSALDQAAALAIAAALFGEFAVTWRDARSPRLNARETTQAAMTDGAGLHVFGVGLALAGLCAGKASSVYANALPTAGMLAVMAALGLLFAPPLMTALSHVVRRELS